MAMMNDDGSYITLSVEELKAYPIQPPLKSAGHVYLKPPPEAKNPCIRYEWVPVIIGLPPTPQHVLQREYKELLEGILAAGPRPDKPPPTTTVPLLSPNMLDFVPPCRIAYRTTICPPFTPCPPYTPTPPGAHLYLNHSQAEYARLAQPLVFAKIGLHCYNLENGTNLERFGLPQVANTDNLFTLEARDLMRNCTCKFETNVFAIENKDCFHVITTRSRTLPPPPPEEEEEEKEESGFDTLSVDEVFKGNMPDWLPDDDTSKPLQYYEMKESEVEQAKEWLLLYAELAWYTKNQTDPSMFVYLMPLELGKVIVQTREGGAVVDSTEKVNNAVFFITFKTCRGHVYKGIIRRTRDGRPQHLSLEAKCFMS